MTKNTEITPSKIPIVSLGDFVEDITPATRHILLERLATENHVESYEMAILRQAAEKLTEPFEDLLRDLRKLKKPGNFENSNLFNLRDAIISEGDFLNMEIVPRPTILAPWLKKGDLVMITAPRGIGKSWLVYSILAAITRGLSIGSWKTEHPVGCLLVDGEMALDDLQKRSKRITEPLSEPVTRLDILSADFMHSKGFPSPNLANAEWRQSFDELLKNSNYGLVVVDNMAALSPGLDENSKQDYDPINQFFLSIRFLGISVILVHHAGKNSNKTPQRGTSSHEDALDTSITLKQPPGYKQTDGCQIVVEFTKSRSVCGDGIKPFTFSLEDQENGSIIWNVKDKSFDKSIVIALLGNGILQKDIPEILHIDKAIVSKTKTKAQTDGLIEEEKRGKCKFTAKGKRQFEDYDISSYVP